MKRKEINSTIVAMGKKQMTKNVMYSKSIVNGVCDSYDESLKKSVKDEFKNNYESSISWKTELCIIGGCLLAGFLIPVSIPFKLAIGLSVGCLAEFGVHNGFQFMFNDLVNKFKYGDQIVYRTKFSMGKFKPVVIGINEHDDVEVRDNLNDNSHGKLKESRLYIADKETIGTMVFKYMHDDPVDLSSVTAKLVKEITTLYMRTDVLHSGKLEELQKSGYFQDKS